MDDSPRTLAFGQRTLWQLTEINANVGFGGKWNPKGAIRQLFQVQAAYILRIKN